MARHPSHDAEPLRAAAEDCGWANRQHIVRLVLREAFALLGVGLVLGAAVSVLAGKLLSAKLYHVGALDPMALGLAVAGLLLCSLVATIFPAVRAASIEPVIALRTE